MSEQNTIEVGYNCGCADGKPCTCTDCKCDNCACTSESETGCCSSK